MLSSERTLLLDGPQVAADEKASELQIQVIRDGSATVPKEFRVVSDSLTAVLEVTTANPSEKLPM